LLLPQFLKLICPDEFKIKRKWRNLRGPWKDSGFGERGLGMQREGHTEIRVMLRVEKNQRWWREMAHKGWSGRATPDILTCPQRLLSDSLPDRAGFDEETEAVVRFGQDWGQRVHLRAQALHRLRVTRCTQLI
jgi:hypothetical protein